MARRTITIEEKIESQKQVVSKIKAKYEENLESIRGIPDQLQNMLTKKQQLSLNNDF